MHTVDNRPRPFEVPAALYPFEDHWFEHAGAAMHYVDVGSGSPPVVMLHGNPTWSFLYRDIIRALPDQRCLAPDLPGFGMSEHPPGFDYLPASHAARFGAWLDHLELDRFVLVVQDWGGPVGLWAATERADRVAGLVVMNTWAWPAKGLVNHLFSMAMGGVVGRYLNGQHNFFADRLVRSGIHTRDQKAPEVFRAYTDPFPTPESRVGTWVFPQQIRAAAPWLAELEQRLGRLAHKPVEMVWAMKDQALGHEEHLQRWLSVWDDAGVTRLQEASHYLQEDDPAAVVAAIRRVLDRVEGSPSP